MLRIGLLILTLVLSGCNSASGSRSQEAGTIRDSSLTIDTIVKGSEFQKPVFAETEKIRDSVVRIDESSKEQDKRLDRALGLIDRLKKEVEENKVKERNNQTRLLTWISAVSLLISGILLYLGQKGLAGIGVTVSL